jgi:peptidoglycan/xylan/chitin deacetylase (PgdA/CDA1 family)
LPFDAGGEDGARATQILDILSRRGLHGTWFLTGDWAQAYPDLMWRVAADRHEIGTHTVDHPNLTQDAASQHRFDPFICGEVIQADAIFAGMTGLTLRTTSWSL